MTERPAPRPIRLPGRIQDRLALGYLYLLFVGITSDSLYYGLVGVNIIQHSTVLDVLLSPLARLAGSLALTAVIVLIPLAAYIGIRYAPPMMRRNLDAQPRMTAGVIWLAFSAWTVFAAYVGFGVGAGHSLRDALAAGQARSNHEIVFQDGTELHARLVGSNSSFVFLVLEGERVVRAIPLHANILSIARLPDES